MIGVGGDQALAFLGAIEAGEDLVRRLDEEFDRELFEEATARVRMRVTPRTWEAFEQPPCRGSPAPKQPRRSE